MARLIFIGIVLAIVALVWRGRYTANGRAGKRILLIGFAGLVVFTVLFPEVTTIVAVWLGIGRGADLVFYVTSFALMFLAAMVYLKARYLEDRIAALVTDASLREWNREVPEVMRRIEDDTPDAG